MHRAELMTLAGAWPAALDEARRAAERFVQGVLNRERWVRQPIARESCIDCAERLLRLRSPTRRRSGVVASRSPASRSCRLGQGKKPAAAASARRALSETDDWTRRASLLPAQVEIELAVGDLERAQCRSARAR